MITASKHCSCAFLETEEMHSVYCKFALKDTADEMAVDFVHLLCCEGRRDREDVSPVNKAQPTHRALVRYCLFGISTEVLLHQTFLLKCQQHMSGRQMDQRLLHTSSLASSGWARSINKVTLIIRWAMSRHDSRGARFTWYSTNFFVKPQLSMCEYKCDLHDVFIFFLLKLS